MLRASPAGLLKVPSGWRRGSDSSKNLLLLVLDREVLVGSVLCF